MSWQPGWILLHLEQFSLYSAKTYKLPVAMTEERKRYILFMLMTSTLLPFLFIVNMPQWGVSAQSLRSISLYVSAVAGYVGMGMMLWQLIFGTRSVTGLYFQDLTALMKVHKKIGIWGTLLIFLHPLFIVLAYGEQWLYAVVPHAQTSFETQVTYGRLAFFGLLVIWLTSAIMRGKIAYRPWKYVHYVAYAVMPLALLHVPEIGSSFANTLVQVYWYSFVVMFLLFVALRLRHVFGFGKRAYRVVSQQKLADATYLLILKPTEKQLQIRAGQYVYVQPGLLHEEHPFTVLGIDQQTGQIYIAYKIFGRFTQKLPNLDIDALVYVDGPYGTFTQQVVYDQQLPAVFIAGGIGVTPFVQHLLNRPKDARRKLFYANSTKQTAIFRDVLRRELGDDYVDIISRDQTPAASHDERGYISADMVAKYVVQPTEQHYFICGPQGLMDTSRAVLLSLGVPASQIHTEDFGF